MRTKLALVLLLAAGGVLGTVAVRARERTYVAPVRALPEAVPFALSGDVPAGYAVRRLAVEGMCCEGCSGKLHRALLAVDGVREAAVDPLAGAVEVLAREDVAAARLAAALTFDKYSATPR